MANKRITLEAQETVAKSNNVEVKKEEKVMVTMNKKEMVAEKVKELLASGLSLDEALTQALDLMKPTTRTVDPTERIELISTINNMQELALAIKCAFGKKSKACSKFQEFAEFTEELDIEKDAKKIMEHYHKTMKQEDFDRILKYEREIKAGQRHYNELLTMVNTSADPIAKAVELGMSPSGIIQLILDKHEKVLDEKLQAAKVKAKLSNNAIKELLRKQATVIPEDLINELGSIPGVIESFKERIKNNDQRIIKLVKMMGMLNK